LSHIAAPQVTRGFFTFDVSTLAGKTIKSAQLRIHGWKTFSATATVCAQEATLASPLAVAATDYQAFTGPLLIDSFSPWDNTGWNTMSLNAAGVAYLQNLVDLATQYAMICTRDHDFDFLDVVPAVLSRAYCHYAADGVLIPELVITYHD